MNNMWGSMAQYDYIAWPWPIAIYLMLAGLSAGSIMTGLIVKWNRHENENNSLWDAVVKSAAIVGPLTIMIGLLLLIVDLGKPLSFYWLLIKYNFYSVMTLGVLVLFAYTPLALVFTFNIFDNDIKRLPVLKLFHPITSFIVRICMPFMKTVEYALFGLAIAVGAYTGFLLSANQLPLWNTPILPLLFLASGVSAGIAANILVSLMFFKAYVNEESIKYLLVLDLRAILVELPLLVVMFVGMVFVGGDSLVVAKQALSVGSLAVLFWVGVVGIGLVAPIIIAFTALRNHAYRVGYIIFNSIVVLVGVLALRWYIVYAGQTFTGA